MVYHSVIAGWGREGNRDIAVKGIKVFQSCGSVTDKYEQRTH